MFYILEHPDTSKNYMNKIVLVAGLICRRHGLSSEAAEG
jgi:hypothetical protein